jgi:hypothetical protein
MKVFNYTILRLMGFTFKIAVIVKLLFYFLIAVILKLVLSIYKTARFDQTKKFSIYTLTKYNYNFLHYLRQCNASTFQYFLAGSAALF